ncbi:MAG: hypothetical protein CTY35_15135 [Methylotenera sp.]|nr:MAG: hypothetical protein CTY35_15135 [Methylotenera sp.]
MADGDKKLNLDMFAKPMGSVETSQGTVYIYSPTIDNYKFYSDLSEETPENRAQKILPILISMIARTSFSEELTPIPLEIYSSLSEADLDVIVDLFHTKLGASRGKRDEKSGVALESRKPEETALIFFDRTLENEITNQKNFLINQRKMILESIESPAKKIFEQLNASTARLGSTLGSYERLIGDQKREAHAFRTYKPEIHNELFEHQNRLNRERNEDRELAKITGRMTAQSAEMLKDLAESAENFLLRFDAKDEKTDKQVNFQLWLGVGSLIITALLALASLVVSIIAFNQDKNELKNATNTQLIHEQKEKELHILIKHQSVQIELMRQQQLNTNAAIKGLMTQSSAAKK